MPYSNYRRYNGKRTYNRRRNGKYTQAERIAFRMGQEQRVHESLSKNGTRVHSAFVKGYAGSPRQSREPLF